MQAPQPELFGTVHNPVLPIWDGPGKVNAELLAKLLNFTKREVATAARVTQDSFSYKHPLPKEVEERLLEWAMLLELVAKFFDGDITKTVLWFKLPNPLLGEIRPRDMIRFGRARKLARIVDNALAGHVP